MGRRYLITANTNNARHSPPTKYWDGITCTDSQASKVEERPKYYT